VRTKTPQQADKMLDAAAQLFGAHRFHEVRMEDIAAEAEVGKGTLYRYFSDKEELYLALLERASVQFVTRVQDEVAHADGAPAKLVALVATILAYFDEQPHLIDLIQRAELVRGLGPGSPWQRPRNEIFRLVLELFDSGQRQGEFRVCDPELAMHMLLGGLRTVIRFGPRPRPRDLAQRIVAGQLEGYAVLAGAAGPQLTR
jgi:AcrR family transcriptional regulator